MTILDDQEAVRLDRRRLRRLVRSTLVGEGRNDRPVTVLVTGDRRISGLCADFLGQPRKTDVLAFPEEPLRVSGTREVPDAFGVAARPLGEVVVNAERAVREARRRGIDAEAELFLYVVHGLLHLAGYDDRAADDACRMHARESDVLHRFGYSVVYEAPVRRAR